MFGRHGSEGWGGGSEIVGGMASVDLKRELVNGRW